MLFSFLTNAPHLPLRLPDMCETCESVRREDSAGHHTFLTIGWDYYMTDGTALWYCSPQCLIMSPVPTLDSPEDIKAWADRVAKHT